MDPVPEDLQETGRGGVLEDTVCQTGLWDHVW